MQLAVFASGGGTNFQSILDHIEEGSLAAEVTVCISDRKTAGALDRAHDHGIPAVFLSPKTFETPSEYSRQLLKLLEEHEVDFIALAGYLRKIPAAVVDAFRHRMVNIHPALLPAFGGKGMYGMNVHEAVLAHGVRWTGVTIHLVDEKYDQGPIVLQQPIPVYPEDTPEQLAERVLRIEHQLYPEALRLFAEDRITVDGRTVRISGDYELHRPLQKTP